MLKRSVKYNGESSGTLLRKLGWLYGDQGKERKIFRAISYFDVHNSGIYEYYYTFQAQKKYISDELKKKINASRSDYRTLKKKRAKGYESR